MEEINSIYTQTTNKDTTTGTRVVYNEGYSTGLPNVSRHDDNMVAIIPEANDKGEDSHEPIYASMSQDFTMDQAVRWEQIVEANLPKGGTIGGKTTTSNARIPLQAMGYEFTTFLLELQLYVYDNPEEQYFKPLRNLINLITPELTLADTLLKPIPTCTLIMYNGMIRLPNIGLRNINHIMSGKTVEYNGLRFPEKHICQIDCTFTKLIDKTMLSQIWPNLYGGK